SPNVQPLQLGSIASFGQRYNWTRGPKAWGRILHGLFTPTGQCGIIGMQAKADNTDEERL
ncbi:MAG: hypothetical protein KAT11_04690, partial [Phycisphaerae bacterium]|nr:hypothetical protein [Phycisphaerae bacterium]